VKPGTLILGALVLFLAFPFGAEAKDPSKQVQEALKEAGENRGALEAVLQKTDPARKAWAEFLIANLPACDLAQAQSEVLLEHLAYADTARQELPWGVTVPEDVFYHYVLPPRVSQEPLEAWRRYFFEQLFSVVMECKTMEEAAQEVNRWCAERVVFKPTQARDQGPLESLKGGYGRCEELSIFYISALRSVGIPARLAWTPYWTIQDNNHAWVEVWADGRWQYTGACEPGKHLCEAWFNPVVKRTGLVLTEAFGVPEKEPQLYKAGQGEARINVTTIYARTGTLGVKVIAGGNPQGKAQVWISVYNWGGLRAIARRECGENGEMSLQIGRGDYVVSCGNKQGFAYKVVKVEAGKASEATLDLESADATFLSEKRFYLNYPKGEEK
jgi:hypothetical protein